MIVALVVWLALFAGPVHHTAARPMLVQTEDSPGWVCESMGNGHCG